MNNGREFLVKRLMEDSSAQQRKKQRKEAWNSLRDDSSPEKSDSTGSNADGEPFAAGFGGKISSPRMGEAPSSIYPNLLGGALQPGSPLAAQYAAAATLASLALLQQQQPAASVSGLSLLHPHLFQALRGFQDIDDIRRVVQSAIVLAAQQNAAAQAGESSSPSTSDDELARRVKEEPTLPKSSSVRKRASIDGSARKATGSVDLGDEGKSPSKKRATRRLQFDDETSSPVSGMYIKPMNGASDTPTDFDFGERFTSGDIDESLNVVEETEEARQKLAEIPNVIGDYICQLCKSRFADAFKLAQHRCPRIGHVEYRCPECDKVFNCPANLASHRRWHRPKEKQRGGQPPEPSSPAVPSDFILKAPPCAKPIKPSELQIASRQSTQQQPLDLSAKPDLSQADFGGEMHECETCKRTFTCHSYLRQHAIKHTAFANSFDGDDEMKCPQCPLWFPSKALVERHARHAHVEDERNAFLCKFCLLTFNTSPALTRHINKHHPSQECRIVLLEELASEKQKASFTNGHQSM